MIKIVTDSKINQLQKKKKSGEANTAEGSSFADLLSQAQTTEQTEARGGFGGGNSGQHAYHAPLHDQPVPQDAAERGTYMLQTLAQLEHDILSGSPTQAVHRLKKALQTQALHREKLSLHMQQLLDEIDLRASVEIAKFEESDQ